MRKILAILFAAGCLAGPLTATASLISYDITVSSNDWVSIGTAPLGLTGEPTFFGSVTLDNTQSGAAAFVDFSLTTNAHTWTMAEYVGPTTPATPPTSAVFDASGDAVQFGLNNFAFGGAYMYFFSKNTMSIYDLKGDWFFCNNCVSTSHAEVSPVPEPGTLALFGLGFVIAITWTRTSILFGLKNLATRRR